MAMTHALLATAATPAARGPMHPIRLRAGVVPWPAGADADV